MQAVFFFPRPVRILRILADHIEHLQKRLSLSVKAAGTVLSNKKSNEDVAKDKGDAPKNKNGKFSKSASRPPEALKAFNKPFKKEEPLTFEEMLSRFKKNSEEKISDIKRNLDGKRGSYSKRR